MSQNFKQQNMDPVATSGLMYPILHFQIQLIFTLKTNQKPWHYVSNVMTDNIMSDSHPGEI